MVYIASIGTALPKNEMAQAEVKDLITDIFMEDNSNSERKLLKLLPIFEHAKIERRQFVEQRAWYKDEHSFKTTNERYLTHAVSLSVQAIDQCLNNEYLLIKPIPYEAIDQIIYISSTGIATPAVDAYIMNERKFRSDINRMPLWGLGCAGGAIGLTHAANWLTANPDKVSLIVACELCSLTFQKTDRSVSNIVGTALFADGISAALLIGADSQYTTHLRNQVQIKSSSSRFERNTLNIMGWDVTDSGLAVIFSKKIPKLVDSLWKKHLLNFLNNEEINTSEISRYLAHPGGKKVLEAMEKVVNETAEMFSYSYDVLRNHGNMSSATVLYVIKKYLEQNVNNRLSDQHLLVSALGPGFSSELLLLEWD